MLRFLTVAAALAASTASADFGRLTVSTLEDGKTTLVSAPLVSATNCDPKDAEPRGMLSITCSNHIPIYFITNCTALDFETEGFNASVTFDFFEASEVFVVEEGNGAFGSHHIDLNSAVIERLKGAHLTTVTIPTKTSKPVYLTFNTYKFDDAWSLATSCK